MIRKVEYDLSDLKKSTDEELVELIYDKAMELHFGTYGESLDRVDRAMVDFLAIWILDSEVKNGGFDQFFRNNGMNYGETALNGFQRIGADDFRYVTEKAIEVYRNQGSEYQYKRNPDFNNLDEKFYSIKGLEKFQVAYIRENYEQFLVG